VGVIEVGDEDVLRFRDIDSLGEWLASMVMQLTIKTYLGCRKVVPSREVCYREVYEMMRGLTGVWIEASLTAVYASDDHDGVLSGEVVPVVELRALNKLAEAGIADRRKLEKLLEIDVREEQP
jgi:hypothetical protein